MRTELGETGVSARESRLVTGRGEAGSRSSGLPPALRLAGRRNLAALDAWVEPVAAWARAHAREEK